MRLMLSVLRTAYQLLYHQFAWTYDLVAAVVSLGRWQSWVRCALPYLNGRVLEIGFGPGHLQVELGAKGLAAFGVDESRQMSRQAAQRLRKHGLSPALSRGYAQNLPFRGGSFDCVVSTFPSEYIFEAQALKEIGRVLTPGGKLMIVPMAWISGGSLPERFLSWLLRFVGETPGKPGQVPGLMREQMNRAGFIVDSTLIEQKGSRVLMVMGTKRGLG
jgi:ubiquinone/menaquinone biosynthesis C-methylase UbiE